MTISTTSAATIALGNGATTIFTYQFVADQASDLLVYYTDTFGTVTLLPGSQYIVSINQPPVGGLWGIGGTITYPLTGSPITVGTSLTIIRNIPETQEVSVQNQGSFYPQAVEQALDLTVLELQQLDYALTRTFQVPIGSTLTPLQYIEQLIAAAVPAGGSSPFTGNVSTVTATSHIVAPTDVTLLCDATANPIAIVLPNPLTYFGRILNIKKIDTTANLVSLTGSVEGTSSYALSFRNQSVTIQAIGTAWSVIGTDAYPYAFVSPGDNLQAALTQAAGKSLTFLPGSYTTTGLVVPSNTQLIMSGRVTITSATNGPILDFTNAVNSSLTGSLSLVGNGVANTGSPLSGAVDNGQVGILLFNSVGIDIDGDIEIRNISGYGVDEQAPASTFHVPGLNRFCGLRVHDCYFGAYVRNFAEYSNYTDCWFYNNIAGLKDESGNRGYYNCHFVYNNYGFFLDGSVETGNNSHGIVSGCFINHNGIGSSTGANITCDTTQLGMLFVGCQILSDQTGSGHGFITIINGARLINFSGCAFGSDINIDATSQANVVGSTIRSTLANPPTVAAGGVFTGTGNVDENGVQASLWNGTNSFTPTLTFSGGNGTLAYTYQDGRKQVLDGWLTFDGQVTFNKGTASGNISMSIPATAGAVPQSTPCVFTPNGVGSSVTNPQADVDASTGTVKFYNFAAGNQTQLTDVDFSASGNVLKVSGRIPLG